MIGGKTKTARPSMRLLLLVGVLTFIVGGFALAPASLMAPALSGAAAPIDYERLEGRLWDGKIVRLNVGEHFLGDVTFSVSPFQAITGRLRAHVVASGGDGAGSGVISYGLFGRSLRIADAEIAFDLASVRRYSIFGLPYQGDLRASVGEIVWTSKGCRIAEAEVWTDLLDASSRQLVGEGMELAGSAACDGERLALMLRGENSEGRTQVALSLAPDLTYQLAASVAPRRPELQENLKRLGFEDNGDALVYDAIGAIKGLGS